MKSVSKIAAVFASIPVAGLIALSGAGAVHALTCAPGYVPVTFNGIQSCSPTGTGGVGGGGSGTVGGGGGSTVPGQAPGIVNPGMGAPPAPLPQVPAPAPAIKIPAAPAPAPVPAQRAPVQQAPAPVRNYTPALPAQTPVQGAPAIPAAPAENAGTEEKAVTEVAPAEETPAPAAEATIAATPTASASPSTSEVPAQADSIDASQASATEQSPIALIFTVLGGVAIAFAAGVYSVRHVRRKNSRV